MSSDPCHIELWLWPLDTASSAQAGWVQHLSPDEVERAQRYVKPLDSQHFIAGRGRLREVLASYLNMPPGAVRFDQTGRKKPIVRGGPAFNLSHAAGWALLAVAPSETEDSLQLGVDIEAHRPVEPRVAEHFFSAQEQRDLARCDPASWPAAFFRCWTRKEAVIKALGTGLYTPLDSFYVTLARDEPVAVRRMGAGLPPCEAWSLRHLDIQPDMPGALAAITSGRDLRISIQQGSFKISS